MTHRSLPALVALGIAATGIAAVPTTAHALAGTVFVNNAAKADCSDTAPDAGTQAQPYCTVQAAVNTAQPGERVEVAAGIQGGGLDLTQSGSPGAPITIIGTDTELASPQPSASPALAFDHVHDVDVQGFDVYAHGLGSAVATMDSSRVDVAQDTIQGSGGTGATAPAVHIDGQSSEVTLSHNTVIAIGSGIAVDAGATAVTVTTNLIDYQHQPAFSSAGSPGTVLVSNTFSGRIAYATAISLGGASTGSTVENNVVTTGNVSGTPQVDGTPVVVSADSVPNTTYDYNTVESGTATDPYSWAGTPYPSASALASATSQAAHEDYFNTPQGLSPATTIDNADADAPSESSTDLYGQPRVDDPLVPNTGTGVGYYDRGAVEYRDPYTITPVLSAPKGPAPLTETVTANASNPWNTPIASYTFDFGDGSTPVVSNTPTATHTYTTPVVAPGTYDKVTVTATAQDGTVYNNWAGVQVTTPAPLVPHLTLAAGTGGQSTLNVAADATGTTDDWYIRDYTVDYGDHTPVADLGSTGTGTHLYAKPGTYTATLTATDGGGTTATTTQQVTVGLAFVGITPVRVLDTRYGTGAPRKQVGPGGVVRVKVTGLPGIPTTGVSAVTLNLTDTRATAGSWVTAYADGSTRPNASNLNFAAGQTNPNLVTVPVSPDGYIDLWNANGDVDLFADIQGYYTDQADTGHNFTPWGPTRVLDTRYGTGAYRGPVGPGSVTTVTLPAAAQNADAVVLNLTETGATAGSWITVYPGTGNRPTASNLNFGPGQTTSNLVVVPLPPGAPTTVRIYNNSGRVNLFADVQGYYYTGAAPAPAKPYVPLTPTRIVDTRYGTSAPKAPVGPGGSLRVKVAGVDGIPLGTSAVLVNLTGTRPSTSTWLTAYGTGTAPGTSNIDLTAGETRPVLAVVPVDSDGCITIQNARGTTDIFADLEGYFA